MTILLGLIIPLAIICGSLLVIYLANRLDADAELPVRKLRRDRVVGATVMPRRQAQPAVAQALPVTPRQLRPLPADTSYTDWTYYMQEEGSPDSPIKIGTTRDPRARRKDGTGSTIASRSRQPRQRNKANHIA